MKNGADQVCRVAARAAGEAFPFEGKVDLRVVRPEKTDEVREITAF